MTFHISVNDNKSEIWREYYEGIKFERPYEVGLKSFVTYNNIFNITERNNKLTFVYSKTDNEPITKILTLEQQTKEKETKKSSKTKRSTSRPQKSDTEIPYYLDANEGVPKEAVAGGKDLMRKEVSIPPGIYEIADLSLHISGRVPDSNAFEVTLNKNTLCVEIEGDIGVDFSDPNSIGPTLGFERKFYHPYGVYTSTRMVDIFPINMIHIRCNLVKSNISDTKLNDDTIYEFPLNVAPGEKIIERPSTTTFYKVNTDVLYELHLKIVDQDNRLVDFRGERVNIVLEFKPMI